MGRFVLKLLIFVAILGGVLCPWYLVSYKWHPYPEQKFAIAQLFAKKAEIEAITVGNSHSAAIDFRSLGLSGYHLWRGGEDSFEANYTIRSYVPELPSLRLVFITVSYHSFQGDNVVLEQRHDIRRRIYNCSPSFAWIEGDFSNMVQGKNANVCRPDHGQRIMNNILYGNPMDTVSDINAYLETDTDGKWIRPVYFQHISVDSLHSKTDAQVVNLSNYRKKMIERYADINERTFAVFENTIQFLQAKGVQPIFYTPTYYEYYNKKSDQESIEIMRENMKRLKKKYGIVYYDFSHYPEISTESEAFLDPHHLNHKGSIQFSKLLRGELERIGVL